MNEIKPFPDQMSPDLFLEVQTLVNWSYLPSGGGGRGIRGYSARDWVVTWTTPAPLCPDDKGEPLNHAFAIA